MADHLMIEGSLLVLNENKKGSAVVVARVAGRSRFTTICARKDSVHLVDGDGNEYLLEDSNPQDIEMADSLGTIIIREMDIDVDGIFEEYAVETDIDLMTDYTLPGRMSP